MISRSFVLTAAHCITKKNTVQDLLGPVKVYVGEVSRAIIDAGIAITIKAKKLIPHEDFDRTKKYPNAGIALIQLESKIEISSNVDIATLPLQYYPDGTHVVMVGWGVIKGNTKSDNLLYGYMQLKNDCKKNIIGDKKSIFCITAESAPQSAPCPGDSGGASFLRYTNIILGVHSQSVFNKITGECLLNRDYKDVSVYFYQNWINNKLYPHDENLAFNN